ncbi:MAG: arsenate reductase family protein [Nibricoccus sp.]
MASKPVVYLYSKCSTCRDASKWLRDNDAEFIEKPIRETPPSEEELRRMLAFQGGNIRRLFNTSGIEYRAQKLAEKLPMMKENDAIALLAKDGRLVKRPFVITETFGLVGFDAEQWSAAFER